MLKCGDVYFLLSEYPEALKRYENAAALATKTSDRTTEGKALSQMGRLYSYLGKNDLAQKHLKIALDLLDNAEAD